MKGTLTEAEQREIRSCCDSGEYFYPHEVGLFGFSIEQTEEAGWKLLDCTFDLHHSEFAKDNVMTEYETKFSEKGKPICRFTACR